jgi:hypothetical protein
MGARRNVGASLAGILATAAVYFLGGWGLSGLATHNQRSPEAYLGCAFLVLMPLAAGLGGAVAGTLYDFELKRARAALLVSPGLYLAVCLLALSLGVSWRLYPGLVVLYLLGAGLVAGASSAGFLLVVHLRRGSPT